jgi:gliding motility-associated-like protein
MFCIFGFNAMQRLLFTSLLSLFSICGFGQVISDFASNVDGWTADGLAPGINYSATGGNPNGYVSAQTPGSIILGATTVWIPYYFNAPVKFEGNKSSYYGGNLRFDASQTTSGSPAGPFAFATAALTSNTGVSIYFYPTTLFQPPSFGTWATFSIPLSAVSGEWKTADATTATAATQAQVLAVISDIASLQIQGLYRNANMVTRIDNVTMYPPIIVSAQPVNRIACNGQTTTFNTLGNNNPGITYHWQYFNPFSGWSDVSNTGGYTNATTATLSVNTTGNFGAGSYRCRISGTAVDDTFSNSVTLTINALPTAPGATGASSCGSASLTLTATGGTAGQYRWYTVAIGGTAITGQTAATYSTGIITTTTNYYVTIDNGTCESTRTLVVATINTIPTVPGVVGASSCGPADLTLTASGGTAGQYRWYTVSTGGTAIAGQTASTYATGVIPTTTNYYVSINNGACEGARSLVAATINTIQAAPGVGGASSCGSASLTLTATGGTAGQYRWYTVATGGTAITGQTAATYSTGIITTTANYYVTIDNGTCESTRTPVVATINTIPTVPGVAGASSCGPADLTLTASGGTAGQYRWYTVPAGGAAIAGQTASTYATGVISTTTNYYVSINNGLCESSRASATATIQTCTVNLPPTIAATTVQTTIEGKVTLNLITLISDPDNNLDLSTLKVIVQPLSGAKASIDAQRNLTLDYKGISFSGKEKLTLEVCDLLGACSQKEIEIDVVGNIIVFNGISPNGDTDNDFFFVQYIDVLEATKKNHVFIYNRWGDVIFDVADYDNKTRVFKGLNNNGNEIPSGSYFYKIVFASGKETSTGYVMLKR